MPIPEMSPDASPTSPDPGAASGQDGSSKGRDRYAQLVSQREEARRARDQAIASVQALQEKSAGFESEVAELRKQVSELLAANQARQAKPSNPFGGFDTADEASLAALMTQGGVDPVTGAQLAPDPRVAARAQYELMQRQAKQIAEQLAGQKVNELEGRLSAQAAQQRALAEAERRIAAVYEKDGVLDPKSPLRQMAAKLAPVFAKDYGQEYAQSPAGAQHLFAEAARLVKEDALQAASTELAQIRAREAAAASRQYGPGGPPVPPNDEVAEGLKRRAGNSGVRDAIKGLGFYKQTTGQVPR